MKNIIHLAATLSCAALLMGAIYPAPAHADDRSHISHDIDDIHRDQRNLEDLYRLRQRQEDRNDWRGIDRTDRAIDELRSHIARDRHDVGYDIQRARADRNVYRNNDSYRYGDSRYRDGSYRNNDNFRSNRNRQGDSSYYRETNGNSRDDSYYRHTDR